MIIMCAKCKKPARIKQRVAYNPSPVLIITAHCHGERESMTITRRALDNTPGLHEQIERGTGVAFTKAAAA